MKNRVWILPYVVLAAGMLFLAPADSALGQQVSVTLVIHQSSGTPSYAVQGPSGMTVEQVMQLAKLKYTATFFPGVGGYALMQVETTPHQAVPPQTDGNFGSPFWLLCINGLSAQLGMSAQKVASGDEVAWYYSTDGKCPRDPVQGQKH